MGCMSRMTNENDARNQIRKWMENPNFDMMEKIKETITLLGESNSALYLPEVVKPLYLASKHKYSNIDKLQNICIHALHSILIGINHTTFSFHEVISTLDQITRGMICILIEEISNQISFDLPREDLSWLIPSFLLHDSPNKIAKYFERISIQANLYFQIKTLHFMVQCDKGRSLDIFYDILNSYTHPVIKRRILQLMIGEGIEIDESLHDFPKEVDFSPYPNELGSEFSDLNDSKFKEDKLLLIKVKIRKDEYNLM